MNKTDAQELIRVLKEDRQREIDRLKVLEKNDINPERQEYLKGLIQGMDWCITNFELNI